MSNAHKNYTRVIERSKNPFSFNWRELFHYRDLVYVFFQRYFHTTYKQTRLGAFWFILHPLLTASVFVVIFSRTLGISTGGAPPVLFYLCGLLFWRFFSYTVLRIAACFTTNASLLGKVYFPRITVPLSLILMNLLTLGFQFAVFAVFMGGFILFFHWVPELPPAGWFLLLPLAVLQLAATSLGAGLCIAALTVKYRDLQHVLEFILQLLLFATPVIYSLSHVPLPFRPWMSINPMTTLIEFSRFLFLGTGSLSVSGAFVSALVSAALLGTGFLLFNRAEKTFVDTL